MAEKRGLRALIPVRLICAVLGHVVMYEYGGYTWCRRCKRSLGKADG